MLTRREILLRGPAFAAAAFAWRATDARAVPMPSTAVQFNVPAGATDCHRHVIGDATQYPYISNPIARYEPARIADMAAFDRAMHIDRVVLVGLTGYGTNNACLLDGLKQLGKRGRGVPIIDESTTERDLAMMDRAGCRGIRFLTIGEGVEGARKSLEWAGRRLKPYGWYISAGGLLAQLDALADTIAASPVPVVFDHFVGARAHLGVAQPGFQSLLKLLKEGNVYVKLSRINGVSRRGPDYSDAVPIAQALIRANPSRILWGTDWPHPQPVQGYDNNTDVSPFLAIDDGRAFNQFAVWAPDPNLRRTILVDNPARLHGF